MENTARMTEYLARECEIHNAEELDAAIEELNGVDLGIFTVPYGERTRKRKETTEISALPIWLKIPL